MPATDTPMQQHQDAIDAERFEGFDTLIATGQPLPVREARTLNDLTACANSFLGVPYPVSYTHLDVYKRQLLGFRKIPTFLR